MANGDFPGEPKYAPTLSRRESLKWLGLMVAGGAWAAGRAGAAPSGANHGRWPALKLPPVDASGYGQDPDLVTPVKAPWPKTLSASELSTVAILADILVPREGSVPSASELHVPDVVDEWVSAPYPPQQVDRREILSLLVWLDDEAALRFGSGFARLGQEQKLAIVDDIAWHDTADEFRRAASAFDRLRSIVLAAFYCSPEGQSDLGYLGGKAIAGDYPGPTREAEQHLAEVLAALQLEPWEFRQSKA